MSIKLPRLLLISLIIASYCSWITNPGRVNQETFFTRDFHDQNIATGGKNQYFYARILLDIYPRLLSSAFLMEKRRGNYSMFSYFS